MNGTLAPSQIPGQRFPDQQYLFTLIQKGEVHKAYGWYPPETAMRMKRLFKH